MKTKHHSLLSAPEIRRGGKTLNSTIHRKWSALALGGFLFTSIFALSAPPVEAQCQQWNVGHGWRFKQGWLNVDLDLHQKGTVITGTARYNTTASGGTFGGNFGGATSVTVGDVDGTVKGDSFAVRIHWDNNTTGVYNGTIGPSGRIEGTGYNQATPSKKVNWYSDTHMACADAAPVKPSAPTQSSGHMPKPAAPAVSPGWAGRWETRTAQGGHYEIIFVQDGDNVRGAFTDLNGNPQYNGSLSGECPAPFCSTSIPSPGWRQRVKGCSNSHPREGRSRATAWLMMPPRPNSNGGAGRPIEHEPKTG